jgi:hypothetical protein
MLTLAFSMVAYIRAFFGPRHQLALEAAASSPATRGS